MTKVQVSEQGFKLPDLPIQYDRPITFVSQIHVAKTMAFEELFSEELALDVKDKKDVLSTAIARWMFVGDELVGETYAHMLKDLDEWIPGVNEEKPPHRTLDRWHPMSQAVYVYSTGILPGWQHQGFGRILKAHLLGVLAGRQIRTVLGHCTNAESLRLNQKFGAQILGEFEDWYGTDETATMYRIDLQA